jgi:hypothetical protein
LPAVIDAAALRENVASFAVCRMLVNLVIAVPMRNPTTKHRAKYAALRAQSRYVFATKLPATAAGKFLTVSKFEPDSASTPGSANV